MLTIYHAPGTRSVRPVWLCHELEVPCEIRTIEYSRAYRHSAEYRAVSPAGKVPAMTDGEITMVESGAMVDYILDRHGEGRLRPPPGTPASAMHKQWCWFAEATLSRPLGLVRILREQDDPASLVSEAARKTRDALAMVEAALGDGGYLLGADLDACDIMMSYSLYLARRAGLLDDYPRTAAYLERLLARPAAVRAFA